MLLPSRPCHPQGPTETPHEASENLPGEGRGCGPGMPAQRSASPGLPCAGGAREGGQPLGLCVTSSAAAASVLGRTRAVLCSERAPRQSWAASLGRRCHLLTLGLRTEGRRRWGVWQHPHLCHPWAGNETSVLPSVDRLGFCNRNSPKRDPSFNCFQYKPVQSDKSGRPEPSAP